MKKKSNLLTIFIFGAMILGIILGYVYWKMVPEVESRDQFAEKISILSHVFLRLVKMIIAPLVFSTLVLGVAKLGDIKAVGRIGAKTMGWFITATFVSLFLGLILVNLLKPGVGLNLPLPDIHASSGVERADMTLRGFFDHIVPESAIMAMAENEILQIVIFALFFGIATAAIGEAGTPIVKLMDSVAHVMLKVTGYVMNFAPFAVFGAMAAIIAKSGPDILITYLVFLIQFYIGLMILWFILLFAGYVIVGKPITGLYKKLIAPITMAFATASSEAAYPRTMQSLEEFGCDNRIVSFVLPLGYSFNLDGSMMYMTFASLFIAQAYGMHLSIEQQITMLLVLMITSKGIAGVPRASLVVIAGTLALFNIPEAGLLLLIGIDHFLDMGRSATNVIGNAMACTAVSKWEGKLELQPEEA
ncbi:dicarboxylate/amino acid:cation symporter [Chitinophaga caeni]|uniref:Dicarboxylate/amino acid:cation symporter n=1 Tax=Chitinophaga caeni TaxID=2029983 RepID=A0A291QU57_9BACT|nr:dicarboxylate/amino acid:cation symporter [Chitinophaga caeni]ATL47465.1 dicarboxylate/amino acid:cation symporter [Chitinophaga caeni]